MVSQEVWPLEGFHGRSPLHDEPINARHEPHASAPQLHALVRWRLPFILGHGLIASVQNLNSISTTCVSVKTAAVSRAGKPLFGCPEWGVVKPSAILPPVFRTRRISPSPAPASGQTSWH